VGNIDFSSSSAQSPNLAPLKYYIFGYDAYTGVVPYYRTEYIVRPNSTVTSKVVNPSQWNTEQYVQLNFTRTSQYVLPIVFRVWGTSVKFLGVIGNNKIGYPGSGSILFRDFGDTEISNWEDDPVLPSFLSNLFSVGGGQVTQIAKLTSKETLEIQPLPFGFQPNYIQCSGLSASSLLSSGNTVKFSIDDTKYIQQAIAAAASSNIKDVFFPAGTYYLRDTFFLNSQSNYSNITLRGIGEGSIIKRLPSTLSNPSYPGLLNFTGQSLSSRISGIKIRSLALDGNRYESFSLVSPLTSESTLQLENADSVVITECTIYDNGGPGIVINSSSGVNITSNKVLSTGRPYEQPVNPLLVSQSENIVLQGNIFRYGTTSPKIVQTDYSTINGNIIRGCGDRGLILETSFQWNAQGNLAYSDNDSLISFIDTYNNSYSRAAIEVRSGFALDPVYMTVTYGGESVGLAKDSISADIYTLSSSGNKDLLAGSFRVLQTIDQLDAGIFSVTLPGGSINQTYNSKTILATGNLTNSYGYMYEVKGTASIGDFRPYSIRSVTSSGTQYNAIKLRNSSDLLGFQIFSASDPSLNDSIQIKNFSNTNLSGLNPNSFYPILDIDVNTNSILIASVISLASEVEFLGGSLSLIRPDYFIADGNLTVHSGG
jgi:parallel beta-helix repeat protein